MAHYLMADYYVASTEYIVEADSEDEALEVASGVLVPDDLQPAFDRSEVLEPLDAKRLAELDGFYTIHRRS